MALNPMLKEIAAARYAMDWNEEAARLSHEADRQRAAIIRLKAELAVAKAEAKAARLELRRLRAEQDCEDTLGRLEYAEFMLDQEGEEKAA